MVVALALSLGALEPGPVAASTPAAAACTADTVLHGDTIVSLADLLSPGQAVVGSVPKARRVVIVASRSRRLAVSPQDARVTGKRDRSPHCGEAMPA